MLAYDFVHLSLYACKTLQSCHVQPALYFINYLVDGELSFVSSALGPYSWEVKDATNRLEGLRFARSVMPRENEYLVMTEAGERIGKQKTERYKKEWNRISPIAERVTGIHVQTAAKAHFLGPKTVKLGIEDIISLTHTCEHNARAVARFLERIG